MDTIYHIRVFGRLWGGGKSCYQYSTDRKPENDFDPWSVVGDFESIIDYHICEERNSYERSGRLFRRIQEFRTLRGWRNGFSDRKYNRLVNGY